MHCIDVTAILDDHRYARLTTAERGALDAHLGDCEPCAQAWQAQSALLALSLPAPPATLLDDVVRAARTASLPAPRHSRAPLVLAAALLAGGAALAAIKLVERAARAPTSAGAGRAERAPAAPSADAAVAAPPPVVADTAPGDDSTSRLVDGAPFMVVSTPPVYPPEALRTKLEGSVVVQFDITAIGATENVSVVSSTDPVFESVATDAVSDWKYMPRIVAGKRVPSRSIQTVIRFALALDDNAALPAPDARSPARSEDTDAAVQRGLTLAWERLGRDDIRGAELALDELRASYELGASELGRVYDIYGYLYTLYRDYGRAIAAYEAAMRFYAQRPFGAQGQWMTLANLYYARNQYDMALRTILTYRQRLLTGVGARSLPPEAYDFIDRLRALGVTEETL